MTEAKTETIEELIKKLDAAGEKATQGKWSWEVDSYDREHFPDWYTDLAWLNSDNGSSVLEYPACGSHACTGLKADKDHIALASPQNIRRLTDALKVFLTH